MNRVYTEVSVQVVWSGARIYADSGTCNGKAKFDSRGLAGGGRITEDLTAQQAARKMVGMFFLWTS